MIKEPTTERTRLNSRSSVADSPDSPPPQAERPALFDVLGYERRIMGVLLGWGVGSTLMGLYWLRDRDDFVRGVGEQFAAWGAIDAFLALNGLRGNAENQTKQDNGDLLPFQLARKAHTLRLILAVNTGLDVLYMLGGRRLLNHDDPRRRGWGWGIVLQALFLFFFDGRAALGIKPKLADVPPSTQDR